jgi:predicted PurR-regulated permease PerM
VAPGFLPLPGDVRWRRVVLLALFLAFVGFFRHLAPVFVCAVLLARGLGAAAETLKTRAKLDHRRAVLVSLGAVLLVLGGLLASGVHEALPLVKRLRTDGHGYVERLLDQPALDQLRHYLSAEGGEAVSERMKHYAMSSVKYATAVAHLSLFLLIGFLLAIIYLLERDEIDPWISGLPSESLAGTFVRWGGYVADAVVITVRIQAVTAVVNALVTLPVLLVLRLPHVVVLFLFILVTGLVPVVGNFIAGIVLSLVAFQTRGTWAVGVFLLVTFFLHKIESYYLTPRLAAQHVRLPGLVLVVSLLLFEQAFGFVGLFLSFPTLYVAMRIRNEWEPAPSVTE